MCFMLCVRVEMGKMDESFIKSFMPHSAIIQEDTPTTRRRERRRYLDVCDCLLSGTFSFGLSRQSVRQVRESPRIHAASWPVAMGPFVPSYPRSR